LLTAMYYVYVLQIRKTGRHYIGQTHNLVKRLEKHSRGETKSMKNSGEFEVVYVEECLSRADAMKREKEIKSYKGGEAFIRLLSSFSKRKIDNWSVGWSPAAGGISSCAGNGTPGSNPGLSAIAIGNGPELMVRLAHHPELVEGSKGYYDSN